MTITEIQDLWKDIFNSKKADETADRLKTAHFPIKEEKTNYGITMYEVFCPLSCKSLVKF